MCASLLRNSLPPPASSIATQHRCASWRNSATARPMRGPRCPDVRCRMLRNIMFGASDAEKRQRDTVRVASRRARFYKTFQKTLFANAEKEKPPDGHPRAFACLGDRGDRSPERGSVVMCAAVFRLPGHAAAVPQRACVRIAAEARRFERIGGVEGGFHGKARVNAFRLNAARLRWARTLHPYFFECKHFFYKPTGGPAVACAMTRKKPSRQTKTGGRSRPRLRSHFEYSPMAITSAATLCRSRG